VCRPWFTYSTAPAAEYRLSPARILIPTMLALAALAMASVPKPDWQADVGGAKVKVYRVQVEEKPDPSGGYDWGPCVMKDGNIYRMWWVRPCAPTDKTLPYKTTDEDGREVEFRYSTRGDRIFYAESRDGYTWHLNGNGEEVPLDKYGPDSPTPVIVLRPSETKNERRHLGTPSVVKVGDTFYLYYEACSEFQVRRDEKGNPAEGQEYQNQVFLARSEDGRHFAKWPRDDAPEPIIRAPDSNLKPGKRRYGLGQPTLCYKDGRFILHYVDSCTWWPDTIIRLESADPTFRDAKPAIAGLKNKLGCPNPPPAGAVAKFAQTDICWMGDSFYLVRPVYGTDRICIMRSTTGVFRSDDLSHDPLDAPFQIALHDLRGVSFRGRLFPRFLRDPHGRIVGDSKHMTVFYGSGDVDGKDYWPPHTWDIFRADLAFSRPPCPP